MEGRRFNLGAFAEAAAEDRRPGRQTEETRESRARRSRTARGRGRDSDAKNVSGPAPLFEDYADDPVGFCKDVLGVDLWQRQQEALTSILGGERTAVKSGNGLGKGFLASCAVLWWVATRPTCTVITTAPTARQVRFVLWRQIRTLYINAVQPMGGRLMETRWDVAHDRYAMGITASEATSFQGFHSQALLVVVDEAAGVDEDIYEAVDSMATAGDPRIIMIGNPTTVTGGFHRAFHRERSLYKCHTMSAMESPNVVAGEVVWPGLVTSKWVEDRKEVWGEDSPMFRARVLGEFPDQGEDTLLALSDIEAAVGGDLELEAGDDDAPVLGVDVARFGADSSCLALKRGPVVEWVSVFHGLDTMKLAGRVIEAVREVGGVECIFIDEVGVGGGVVDRLKELGFPVVGINVGRPAGNSDYLANQRAEGYWELRRLLGDRALALPNDLRLVGELADLKYQFSSDGKLIMESKESMKARGGSSPDVADSVMLCVLGAMRRAQFIG